VGLNQRARMSRAAVQASQTEFEARLPFIRSLLHLVPDVEAAAATVVQMMATIAVGPSALFWGLTIPRELTQSVRALHEDARVRRLLTAATTGAGSIPAINGTTFYIGIGGSASYLISGGYSLGFLLGTSGNHLAVVSLNVGLVTNAGIQGSIDLGVFPGPTSDYTGFGSFLQIDGGEVLQGSIGASGGIPLHLRTWDNCGLTITPAIGVSVLPVDLAGGFAYTFQMARL
jgi:hypothetical protein